MTAKYRVKMRDFHGLSGNPFQPRQRSYGDAVTVGVYATLGEALNMYGDQSARHGLDWIWVEYRGKKVAEVR